MIFNFENERSAEATITASVMKSVHSVVNTGNEGTKLVACSFLRISDTLYISAMSSLKYRVN